MEMAKVMLDEPQQVLWQRPMDDRSIE